MTTFDSWNNVAAKLDELLYVTPYEKWTNIQKGSAAYNTAKYTIVSFLHWLEDEKIIDDYNFDELEATLDAWAKE